MFRNVTKPWYWPGLRFSCTRCGYCCTGDPGYVWVDSQEIGDLAVKMGLPIEEFAASYVRRVGSMRALLERKNGDCIFFDPHLGCTVYEQRPRQCRSWPFWESNLESSESWARTTRICPGAGQGEMIPAADITRLVKLIKL